MQLFQCYAVLSYNCVDGTRMELLRRDNTREPMKQLTVVILFLVDHWLAVYTASLSRNVVHRYQHDSILSNNRIYVAYLLTNTARRAVSARYVVHSC